MKALNWLVPCLVAASFAACGGGQKSPESPADESPSEVEASESEEPAGKAWKDMDRDERMEFMGLTVMPAMQEIFSEFDAEGYKEFKCQTCHGDDMREVDYKMPNGLYALPLEDPITASKDYDEATTTFMMEKVVPKMAELLGEEPVTELKCASCHDVEE